MARLATIGLESGSLGVFDSVSTPAPSVVTSPVRTGTYSLDVEPSSSANWVTKVFAPAGKTVTYHRFYVYVDTQPAANNSEIFEVSGDETMIAIHMHTNRTIQLYDVWNGVYIGSASAALSTGTFYRIEVSINCTTQASTAVVGRINGTQFASGTVNMTGTGIPQSVLYGTTSAASYALLFDDMAVNDNAGAVDNSWVGGLGEYTREAKGSLPSDSVDLATVYSDTERSNAAADDSTYVNLRGAGYLIHQFSNINSNNTDRITATWNGQARKAPSSATVYLQIYNFNSSAWETVSSNNSAAAATDFTLTGAKTTSLSNYYNTDKMVTWRVYQQA